jgi:hypothetical protein
MPKAKQCPSCNYVALVYRLKYEVHGREVKMWQCQSCHAVVEVKEATHNATL